MSDMNTKFCAILLTQVLLDLTGREKAHFKANASVVSPMRNWYFVEWPHMGTAGKTFSLEVEADNTSHAKAQFLQKWLDQQAPAARQRHSETGFPGEPS